MAGEHGGGAAASNTGLGGTVPPQGVPGPAGRRGGQDSGEQHALPPALPAQAGESDPSDADHDRPTGRRRRALASANERAAAQEAAPRQVFALPPADVDRSSEGTAEATAQGQVQGPTGPAQGSAPGQGRPGRVQVPGPAAPGDARPGDGRHDAVPHDQSEDHTPPQPHPAEAPTGRRRRAGAAHPADEPAPVPTGRRRPVPLEAFRGLLLRCAPAVPSRGRGTPLS
ncbi:nickel transporter, partial [Streptomyces sp. NPDC005549]